MAPLFGRRLPHVILAVEMARRFPPLPFILFRDLIPVQFHGHKTVIQAFPIITLLEVPMGKLLKWSLRPVRRGM